VQWPCQQQIDLKVRLATPLDKSNRRVQYVVRRHVGQRSNGGTCVHVVVREWTNTMPELSHSLGTTPAHSPPGEISMKATRLYRIASVLLFVVAVGNTYGLLNFWHVAAPMPPVRFPIGHADFSYAQVVLGYQVLLYVYFVCSIPCLASGCSGSNDSPRHWRIGVDSLHLPDPWSLHKLDVLLRRCVAPRACYCCLYRLGDLVGDSRSSVPTGAE
jgi:hypothetical protein